MWIFWTPLIPALLGPFFGALFYFVLLPGSGAARAVYGGVKLFTLAWPILWMHVADVRTPEPERRSIQDGNLSAVLGLASGLGLGVLFLAAYHFGLDELLRPHIPAVRAKAEALGVLDCYVPFALFISLAHSFLEEFYWRWFVFGRLRRVLPHSAAVLVGSLAFALHHYVIVWVFFGPALALALGTAVGIGGAFWALLYDRTRSLAGPWISHALADAALMAIGYGMLFG